MIDIVVKYNSYLDELPDLIKQSYYKAEYFIKNLKISEATYYRKIRERNFTPKEVEIITELLFPEELLFRALQRGEDDIKAGRVKPHNEVMQNLRSKYGI
jgi:hypothetical protein